MGKSAHLDIDWASTQRFFIIHVHMQISCENSSLLLKEAFARSSLRSPCVLHGKRAVVTTFVNYCALITHIGVVKAIPIHLVKSNDAPTYTVLKIDSWTATCCRFILWRHLCLSHGKADASHQKFRKMFALSRCGGNERVVRSRCSYGTKSGTFVAC